MIYITGHSIEYTYGRKGVVKIKTKESGCIELRTKRMTLPPVLKSKKNEFPTTNTFKQYAWLPGNSKNNLNEGEIEAIEKYIRGHNIFPFLANLERANNQ